MKTAHDIRWSTFDQSVASLGKATLFDLRLLIDFQNIATTTQPLNRI